jgi:hypothetical protein
VKAAIFRKSQETEYDLSGVSRRDAGQDFEGIILVVGVPGAIGQGIHSLKVARPFAGMAVLSEEFQKTSLPFGQSGLPRMKPRSLFVSSLDGRNCQKNRNHGKMTSRRNSTPIWKPVGRGCPVSRQAVAGASRSLFPSTIPPPRCFFPNP